MFKAIPTPSSSALELGPLTIHFYALCIIAGVAVAIWLGDKRLRAAFPNTEHVVADVAIFAIPAGVIGGRLYHVATTPEKYFGASGSPADILKIWQGGLGIWGAIALGALGAYLAYRRLQSQRELPGFANFLDALAPGLLLAQAVGRWQTTNRRGPILPAGRRVRRELQGSVKWRAWSCAFEDWGAHSSGLLKASAGCFKRLNSGSFAVSSHQAWWCSQACLGRALPSIAPPSRRCQIFSWK